MNTIPLFDRGFSISKLPLLILYIKLETVVLPKRARYRYSDFKQRVRYRYSTNPKRVAVDLSRQIGTSIFVHNFEYYISQKIKNVPNISKKASDKTQEVSEQEERII